MTEKKEKIIEAALKLFAKEGFYATSTSKVAKEASVSEGLIFRHFGNKEGLLNAILEEGKERIKNLFADIVLEADPRKVIRKTLELPFTVKEKEYDFWKLQFKLKWELEDFYEDKTEPLKRTLIHAFEKLEYEKPVLESEFLIHYIDGISAAILKNTLKNREEFKQYILKKYKV